MVEDIVELLAGEFVDYGYYKTTVHLQDEKGYVINHKKVYRLMRENKLLIFNRQSFNPIKRQWVKELVPDPVAEFCYLEFDIKYIYVQGKRANAQVLTVLDVFSRWNMAGRPVASDRQVEHQAGRRRGALRENLRELPAARAVLRSQRQR